MNGRRNDKTATFVQTLIFYDEPQLILLRSETGADIIGVAVSRPDMEHPFFSCEVRKKAFRRYLEGKADLHYLFKDAVREKYFFIDLEGADSIQLREATPDE